ncbi:hypothetical protein L0222_28665 [bacterium]|nr:hypothetical protein [bacterium]
MNAGIVSFFEHHIYTDVRGTIKYFRVCPILSLLFFLFLLGPVDDLTKLSRKERENYLQRAKVWQKTDIPRMNILAGPQNEIAVPPEAEVLCHYVEERGEVIGASPKFKCKLLDTGEVVRIKYSRRETFAEIAGTRLLWTLGFSTDEVYPIELRCFGCPQHDPSKPSGEETRMERVVKDGIMERNFDGMELAQFPDQGWKWRELDRIAKKASAATKAEMDALKLLAVFIQHTDSKPPQQRLGCYDKDLGWQDSGKICTQPVLMIQDLGATFGVGDRRVGGFSAMYYKGLERIDIWNNEKEDRFQQETGRRACFGRLTSAFQDGLMDPEISEGGRQFLDELLNQLSEDQIRDLFRVARADETDEVIFEKGRSQRVTIDHWVSAFKKKRDQIHQRTCS